MTNGTRPWAALLVACLTSVASVAAAQGPATVPAQASGQPAFLGVQLEADPAGVRVVSVVPDSPAARGGITTGDVLTQIATIHPTRPVDVTSHVRSLAPGARLELQVNRGGQAMTVRVVLTARPTFGVTVNSPAPAIASHVVMGPGPGDLSQLRGKVVIVDFWASWCGPCRSIMPALDEIHRRHARQGLSVIGVTDEPADVARNLGAALSIHYTLATDGMAAVRYAVNSLPTMVIIDKKGVVRKVSVGASADEMRQIERLVVHLLAEP